MFAKSCAGSQKNKIKNRFNDKLYTIILIVNLQQTALVL